MIARTVRFPLVDSLRAVAALAILAFHVAVFSGSQDVGFLSDVIVRLQVGVALFFLISGFLLYRPFVAARLRREGSPRTAAYAWRRFLRIVPAYWVVLTFVALTTAPAVFDRPIIFYGFLQVYDAQTALAGLPVAWTLCIEVAFYALLPLYAILMRGMSRGRAVQGELVGVAVLIVAGLGFRIWAHGGGAAELGAPLLTLPAFLDWFGLGIGMAIASVWLDGRREPPRALRWLDRRAGVAWLFASLAFGMSVIAGAQLAPRSLAQDLAVHVLYGLTSVALLAPAVLGDPGQGRLRKALAGPVLAWLGLVSYAVYLWQVPVIDLMGELTSDGRVSLTDPNPIVLLAPPVVVAVAALSYYGFERPILSLKGLVPAAAPSSRRSSSP